MVKITLDFQPPRAEIVLLADFIRLLTPLLMERGPFRSLQVETNHKNRLLVDQNFVN